MKCCLPHGFVEPIFLCLLLFSSNSWLRAQATGIEWSNALGGPGYTPKLSNNAGNLHFSILPNPSSGSYAITSISPVTEIKVFSISGIQVLKISGENILTFDLSSWPAGIYLVQVNNSLVYKIVKQ